MADFLVPVNNKKMIITQHTPIESSRLSGFIDNWHGKKRLRYTP